MITLFKECCLAGHHQAASPLLSITTVANRTLSCSCTVSQVRPVSRQQWHTKARLVMVVFAPCVQLQHQPTGWPKQQDAQVMGYSHIEEPLLRYSQQFRRRSPKSATLKKEIKFKRATMVHIREADDTKPMAFSWKSTRCLRTFVLGPQLADLPLFQLME